MGMDYGHEATTPLERAVQRWGKAEVIAQPTEQTVKGGSVNFPNITGVALHPAKAGQKVTITIGNLDERT